MTRSTPISPIETVVTTESSPSKMQGDAVAALVSLCVHLVCLLLLALWVIPSLAGRGKRVIEIAFNESEAFALQSIDVPESVEMPLVDEPVAPAEVPSVFQPINVDADLPTDLSADQTPVSSVAPASSVSLEPNTFSIESLSSSQTVEGAVDRITGELYSRLDKGDLLVVWLLDASNSLVDDRQRVAARLTPFYDDIVQKKSSSEHQLLSAVVSYGSRMRERVAPTKFGNKIVAAVEKLPVDRSGDEKVFDAVAKCAAHYRESWDKQCVIVIWTDESGDDTGALAETIAVCRSQQVSVSVVGPSSVLGADTGLHSYTHPQSGDVYQLPVRRGPETAMPERLELGYWYPTRFRGNGFGRGRRGGLPSWLGGQDLAGILAGFSPYALTRLVTQTGGSYTIFDRPEDRGPFDPIAMKRYAPSYGSPEQYKADVQANPLRRAVMNAVGELRGKKIDMPPNMLFVKKTGERHFDFMRYYYTPNEFQAKLRTSRGRLKAQATRSSKYIDQALRHLSTDKSLEIGLEDEYRYEVSPRWKAWYDLTRGRLLANSARLEEYRLVLDAIAKPGALQSNTNHVILVADQMIRAGEIYQERAEEAERLLRRCVSENQGTPWETLAQRELDFAIGIVAKEMSLTQNPSGPSVRQPNLPRF